MKVSKIDNKNPKDFFENIFDKNCTSSIEKIIKKNNERFNMDYETFLRKKFVSKGMEIIEEFEQKNLSKILPFKFKNKSFEKIFKKNISLEEIEKILKSDILNVNNEFYNLSLLFFSGNFLAFFYELENEYDFLYFNYKNEPKEQNEPFYSGIKNKKYKTSFFWKNTKNKFSNLKFYHFKCSCGNSFKLDKNNGCTIKRSEKICPECGNFNFKEIKNNYPTSVYLKDNFEIKDENKLRIKMDSINFGGTNSNKIFSSYSPLIFGYNIETGRNYIWSSQFEHLKSVKPKRFYDINNRLIGYSDISLKSTLELFYNFCQKKNIELFLPLKWLVEKSKKRYIYYLIAVINRNPSLAKNFNDLFKNDFLRLSEKLLVEYLYKYPKIKKEDKITDIFSKIISSPYVNRRNLSLLYKNKNLSRQNEISYFANENFMTDIIGKIYNKDNFEIPKKIIENSDEVVYNFEKDNTNVKFNYYSFETLAILENYLSFENAKKVFALIKNLNLSFSQTFGLFKMIDNINASSNNDKEIVARVKKLFKIHKETETIYFNYALDILRMINTLNDINNENKTLVDYNIDFYKIKTKEIKNVHDNLTLLVQKIPKKLRVKYKKEIYKKIKKYEYKSNKNDFLIKIPKDLKELINEGNAMNHCVGSYAKKVVDNKSIIVFMRRKSDVNNRLLTIEINNKKIIQAKGKYNQLPTDELKSFLEEWSANKGLKISKNQR